MKSDIKTMLEFAGVDITQGTARKLVESVDAKRLNKLINYYVDGWGGFSDNPDRDTKAVMAAVQSLKNKDLAKLSSADEAKAKLILSYGSDVNESKLVEDYDSPENAKDNITSAAEHLGDMIATFIDRSDYGKRPAGAIANTVIKTGKVHTESGTIDWSEIVKKEVSDAIKETEMM